MNYVHCVGRNELPDQSNSTVICGHLCFQVGKVILVAATSTAARELGRLRHQSVIKTFFIHLAISDQQK